MAEEKRPEISLELKDIKKDYYVDKKPFPAIRGVSVSFPKHGFIAILGASGSGKTTLLNIIGGLDHYTSGDLLIDGVSTKDYTDRDWDAYRNRKIGFVFQSYNLIPHLTLLQNVEVSLQLGGVSAKERSERAIEVLQKVGLGDYVKKKPNQLSGGQMQRVAIARALINRPSIILADEPTGALDSKTSVQVLDLIKEVGKECCVIMVTHNEELANQYADRIIRMKDGLIVGDSAPLAREEKEAVEPKTGHEKHTSMSFFTALRSSMQNVLTKKGRTALTSIACSIGIIGVALVLATSNGFSQYVDTVEASVASSVPITISPTTYTYESSAVTTGTAYPDDNKLHIEDDSKTVFVAHQNDFTNEYMSYIDRIMNDPSCSAYGDAMSIMYNRQYLDFHFTTTVGTNDASGGEVFQVSQYTSAGTMSSALSSVTSLPATIMHELYGNEENLSSMYEIINGRFPKKADELVLIVDKYNQISLSTLQNLGIIRSNIISFDDDETIDFDDIVYSGEGDTKYKTYKAYTNSAYYHLSGQTPKTYDVNCYDHVYFESYEGVDEDGEKIYKVRAKSGDAAPATKQITYYEQEDSAADIYANKDGKYAGDGVYDCKIVGVLRPAEDSYLSFMPASIGFTEGLKDLMAADYQEGGAGHVLAEASPKNWCFYRSDSESTDGLSLLNKSLSSISVKSMDDVSSLVENFSSSTTSSLFSGALRYFTTIGKGYTTSISTYLRLNHMFGGEFEKLEDSTLDFTQFFDETNDFFNSSCAPNLVDYLASYNAYSLISSILIFPKSLTTKDSLRGYLDAWNGKDDITFGGKTIKASDRKNIIYSDIMNDFTGSLGTMINVISAILVVFASISLVVSSVMTAIITYVSVVERTKEIGVLRACGARKKDVGRLFEAECVIVGGVAGAIGVLVTLIACLPINQILDHLFPGNGLSHIAQLNPWHALLLIVLAIALAFVSGFIPSRMASKKDPVVCLRSE